MVKIRYGLFNADIGLRPQMQSGAFGHSAAMSFDKGQKLWRVV
jgi:hypothetical protein